MYPGDAMVAKAEAFSHRFLSPRSAWCSRAPGRSPPRSSSVRGHHGGHLAGIYRSAAGRAETRGGTGRPVQSLAHRACRRGAGPARLQPLPRGLGPRIWAMPGSSRVAGSCPCSSSPSARTTTCSLPSTPVPMLLVCVGTAGRGPAAHAAAPRRRASAPVAAGRLAAARGTPMTRSGWSCCGCAPPTIAPERVPFRPSRGAACRAGAMAASP